MRIVSRKDIRSALITGLTTGILAWQVFLYLGRPAIAGISLQWLVLIVPVLWIVGVQFGYFLGQWLPFFTQFGRFAAVGFANAAVDFGVFNFLFALSHESDTLFPVLNVLSFSVAVTHSYFWNKYWVFQSGATGGAKEFTKFIAVNIIAILINTGIAFLIFHFGHVIFQGQDKLWANMGKVAGTAIALLFTFTGSRLIVFKKY